MIYNTRVGQRYLHRVCAIFVIRYGTVEFQRRRLHRQIVCLCQKADLSNGKGFVKKDQVVDSTVIAKTRITIGTDSHRAGVLNAFADRFRIIRGTQFFAVKVHGIHALLSVRRDGDQVPVVYNLSIRTRALSAILCAFFTLSFYIHHIYVGKSTAANVPFLIAKHAQKDALSLRVVVTVLPISFVV